MFRKTKIVTTLGPATDDFQVLKELISAGANVVRLNFSHGVADDHRKRAENVRQIAAELGCEVGILGDLQGPKIRVSTFRDKKVQLAIGDAFVLDGALPRGEGDQQRVGIDYKSLPQEVVPGDVLLLDDGRVQLEVVAVEGVEVQTRVTVGGPLSDNKGINKLGGGLAAAALTEKDKADIKTAAEIGVDFLAVSFPRSGEDLHYARRLAHEAGLEAAIVAKVERAETVESDEAMDDIIQASDAVMVARGDLGVEIGDSELVGVQKRLIRRACAQGRPVITATQMMESMIQNPMPTRAEVMDVANAVLDGTDAVMLSAESAAGAYPVETVKAMAEICRGAESQPSLGGIRNEMPETFDSVEQSIALSANYIANHLPGVEAIVSLTTSGQTPLLISRVSADVPIVAFSHCKLTLQKLALCRGILPVYLSISDVDGAEAVDKALDYLREQGLLERGDQIVLTQGDRHGIAGSTNCCRVLPL